jgi:hypothetical protein
MQVLTPSGYVDIIDLNIGDEVIAYDINTGAQIINHLEGKTLWTPDMYPAEYTTGHYDEEGNWVPPVLVNTSYEVFQRIQGDWFFYRINGTFDFYKSQSVWANMNVVHASDLQIGDIIYNDLDGDVVITSIEEVDTPLTWWKLDVSGDSSYIADDITLHNASRYWVGGGSSSNWNATGNTNWSASTGGANNASVPTSADVANFDGAGNSSSVISATITIGGLIITSAYTATITHDFALTVAGSITLGANYTIAGTAALRISAACTFTSNGKTWPNSLIFTTNTTTTLVGNLAINGLWEALVGISPTINSTTTETLTCAGGIRYSNNCIPTGTAKHIATGGTIDSFGGGAFKLPLDINGNITLSSFNVEDKVVNYIGGTVTVVAGSTFSVGGSATVNLAGIIFNNFSQGNAFAYTTFTSSIIVNGLLSGAARWNKTSSETITVYGGITAANNSMFGTMPVICKGGTITTGLNSGIYLPLTLDGNITFASNVFYNGGALKYLSGTNNASTTRLYITDTCTLDVGVLTWNGVTFTASNKTITLLSNLTSTNVSDSTYGHTMNKTTNEKFFTAGITSRWPDGIRGTATIQLTGGTWTATLATAFISSDMEINGNVIISGNVYYQTGTLTYISGTVTGVSSGTLILNSSTQTLAFNAGANMQVPMTFAGGTKTLSSNFSTGGLVTISAATIINKTSSEVFSYGGGLTMNSTLGGTATVNLTGGTWSGASTLSSPLNINGNITISGNVYYSTGTITYVSGTPIVTGSTLNLTANCTLNTSTMAWNNFNISSGTIYTLTSDLNINGVLSANVGGGTKINKTTNESIYCFGGFSIGNNFTGTATIVAKGGTLISNGFAAISGPPLNIDGDVTISGSFTYGGGTMTYLSGSVNTQGTTLSTGSSTLNTKGIEWNNVTIADTVTLSSDMVVNGFFTNLNGSFVNKTNNEILYLRGGLNVANFWMRGNGTISLQGGTWTQTAIRNVECNMIIDGNVTFGSNCAFSIGTLTYKSGTILGLPLNIVGSCNIIDFNKCSIMPNVIVTTGSTITMNQFFTGTPQKPVAITASTAAGTYTIAFQDTFEKVATNVVTSGCVLSRPMQLIVSSPFRINSIRTTNSGIRYVNQSPNGFAKNTPAVAGLSTGVPGGLLSDPCFTKQS